MKKYYKDGDWIIDELTMVTHLLSTPTAGANTFESKVGAAIGTCFAARTVLEEVIDVLKEVKNGVQNTETE